MIELRCPSCRQSIRLDDSFAGRRVSCVGCRKEFAVPDASQRGGAKGAGRGASSVALSQNEEQTLLETARRHRDLVMGGIIAAALAVAAFIMYSAMPGDGDEDEPVRIAQSDGAGRVDSVETSVEGSESRAEATTPQDDGSRPSAVDAEASSPPLPHESSRKKPDGDKPKPEAAVTPDPENRAKAAGVDGMKYTSAKGVLLRESEELDDWITVTRDTELPDDLLIAVPPPFTARIEIGGDCSVRLLGGTLARTLPSSGDVPAGLELRRGRLMVAGKPSGGDSGAVFLLGVRQERWQLELLEGNTVFGVEILPRRPERFEQDFGGDSFTGGILVVKGSVGVTAAAGRTRVVAGNSWLSLAHSDRVDGGVDRGSAAGGGLPRPQYRAVPEWLDLDKTAAAQESGPDAELFERSFNRQQAFGEAIRPLRSSSDRRAAVLAVQTQALLGRRAALIQAMAESKHTVVRAAAVEGLREQMPAAKEDRAEFRRQLAEAAGDSGDAVYKLLWGYSGEEVRTNRFICDQLIFWLRHQKLLVRELAWEEITTHSDARYGYQPEAPLRSRNRAVKLWQMHVQKNGTILGNELR